MNPSAPAPTTSAQAMQNMQSYQSGMKTPDQLLQQEQQNLGTTAAQQQVSGLQKAIQNTTNLLNNVAPSVMGRTQNSLVTDAQANAQIANAEAPINQNLNQQQNDFNTANSNYQNLQQQAENLANSNETAQQNQLGYLQNIYQALYGQEQAKAAQQAQADALAEQKREFNLSNTGSGTPFSFNNGSSSGSGSSSNGGISSFTGAAKRAGGGFNFVDTTGSPISALQWAQGHGISNFRNVLQYMASQGDQGAKAGLSFIGNDGNADPTKVTNQGIANLYHALTGRTVGIYNPNKRSAFPNSGTGQSVFERIGNLGGIF